MDKQIEKIIEDLLRLEPSLSEHRRHLKSVLTQMLQAQPEVQIDESFREGLKRKILAKLEVENSVSRHLSWGEKIMLSKFNVGMAVVALVAITASAVMYEKTYGPITSLDRGVQVSQGEVVKDLGVQGFGKLAVSPGGGMGGGGGGGDLGESGLTALPDAKIAVGMGGGSDASILPYKIYKFSYAGEEFSIDADSVSVYRKSKNSYSQQATKLLRNFKLKDYGVRDLQNPRLDSLMISDDRNNGYSFYIDFLSGNLNINQNYSKWNSVEKQCAWDQECIKRLTGGGAVPTGEEVINIAERFLVEQGISKVGFGDPVVSEQQMRILASARSVDPAFVSPIVTVVYPRIIDGREVKDEAGNPAGVYVNVNIWDKAVVGVSDLGIFNLEKASYASEASAERIIRLAETGSYYGYNQAVDPNTQVENLKLGTPKKGLVKMWVAESVENGSEVFVEALLFPILNAKETGYYAEYVAIPLAKEILDNAQRQVAVPLMESNSK